MLRILKIASAIIIGLTGLLAFLNNLLNINSAQSFVSLVISGPEQPYYKIMGPTFGSAWQAWLGLITIMLGELVVGVFGLLGAIKMIGRRTADAAAFQDSKTHAIAAGILGVIIWYGFFVTIGEMYFNMWQTEIGLGSVNGAFRYGTVCAVLTFIIAMRDD